MGSSLIICGGKCGCGCKVAYYDAGAYAELMLEFIHVLVSSYVCVLLNFPKQVLVLTPSSVPIPIPFLIFVHVLIPSLGPMYQLARQFVPAVIPDL